MIRFLVIANVAMAVVCFVSGAEHADAYLIGAGLFCMFGAAVCWPHW